MRKYLRKKVFKVYGLMVMKVLSNKESHIEY